MTVNVSSARDALGEIVNRVAYGKERVILARRGKRLAALIPIDELELLEALEDKIDLEAARKALKEPKTVSWEKVKAKIGL